MFLRTPLVQKLPQYLATLPQGVYSEMQISQLVEDYAKAVNDPFDAATQIYLQYMVDKGAIRQIVIDGERRSMVRYLTKNAPSQYEIGCSLQHDGYLSHHTAAYLHQLTEKEPPVIYVSAEGPKREKAAEELDQEKIDAAFQRPQRESGARMNWGKNNYLLLAGSHAGGAGVERKTCFSFTGIDRTLIDLTVRPAYGGGAVNVAKMYKKAIHALSFQNIFKLLEKLAYRYPYHQSIGFYLSLAGYNDRGDLDKLKKIGLKYSFYLEYEMTDPVYSDEWNIYFPNALIVDNR